MNYNISSSTFEHPLLKPLLEQLSEYLASIQTEFFVIGATARDILMDIHGEKSGRATNDLDIAVAISDWSKYEQIESGLTGMDGFRKDKTQKQRFIYQDLYILDIVPYGEIMKMDDKIFWPPDESIAMSVLGFSEVGESTKKVIIDDSLTIEVASLAGVFLLKMVAWHDRHNRDNRDADDMGFILRNYFAINESRVIEKHNDLYDVENFNTIVAGATLLGRDLADILSASVKTKNKIHEIIQNEINKQEESILLNQILETNRSFKYEEILQCWINISTEIMRQSN